jgi:hypothetical protein
MVTLCFVVNNTVLCLDNHFSRPTLHLVVNIVMLSLMIPYNVLDKFDNN